MKKFIVFFTSVALGGIFLTSCNGNKEASPEEEVKDYGKYFVEKLNAGQLDSIQSTYPDIAKADSIVPIQSDTIIVAETQPGQYVLTLAEGMTLKVNRSETGNISVTESKGLFAYPADKVEIARETGMWDDNLSDAQLNERMKDEGFFNMINKKSSIAPNKIITAGKMVITKEWSGIEAESGSGYFPLKNNTDIPISGSDYQVVIKVENVYSGDSWTYTEAGKDIDANGSTRINVAFRPKSSPDYVTVKFKIPDNELKAKFAPSFSGKEYQEYLDSKK